MQELLVDHIYAKITLIRYCAIENFDGNLKRV
jgi:hypothetical protein